MKDFFYSLVTRTGLALGMTCLACSPAAAPAARTPAVAPSANVNPGLVPALEAHLDALARTDQLSGIVLIARDGRPIFTKAYGFANLADRVRNQEDTRFNLASMGKMFTGVAIMQLVEAGRLSLEDKVGKYLPDYPREEVRSGVTIHQLLTHTAGLGNFLEQLGNAAARERFKAVADYLPLFVNQPLLFPPGTGFAYSNSGFMILGLVIEAVTGQSYFDYVTERIFKRAGMSSADSYELDYVAPRLATGYTRSKDRPGQWMNNMYVNVVKGGPAGGSYSTAADLLSFANALTKHELLSKASTDTLTTGKVDYGTRKYAYGFSEEISNGHRIIGHGGGNVGIADELMVFTDLGYTAVILTNGDVDNFWDIQSFIKRQLIGPTPETDSYEFTRRVIQAALEGGYEAGVAALGAKPRGITVRDSVLEQAGYRLLSEGRYKEAIVICRLDALAFPKASHVYLGLADAYNLAGDRPRAVESYKTYLAMEPDDTEARQKLERLDRAAGRPHP